MFCPNCGTQIPDNSQFCGNCGNQVKGVIVKGDNFDFKKILDFIVLSNKDPILACKNFSDKLLTPFIAVYFALLTIGVSVINAVTVKSGILSYINKIIALISKLSGLTSDASSYYSATPYANEITNGINTFVETLFPFSKIFSWFLAFSLIFYILIILLVYLYHNVILRTKINFNNYLIVASVALTIQFEISFVAFIFSLVSLYLAIIVTLITVPLVIIILYKGLGNLVEDKPYYPYCLSIIYIIATLCAYYTFNKLISSHITDLVMKGLADITKFF